MYSNNIVNFEESTTISLQTFFVQAFKPVQKMSVNLLNAYEFSGLVEIF